MLAEACLPLALEAQASLGGEHGELLRIQIHETINRPRCRCLLNIPGVACKIDP
jgi:hypothetical protein